MSQYLTWEELGEIFKGIESTDESIRFQAISRLVENYKRLIYFIIRKSYLTKNPDAIEDIYCTTIVNILTSIQKKSIEDFKNIKMFNGWVIRITKNQASQSQQKEINESIKSQNAEIDEYKEEDIFLNIEKDFSHLNKELSLLSEREKEVLRLDIEEEMSFAEIGNALNITTGNARQISFRIRHKLKKNLWQYYALPDSTKP